MRDWGVGPGGDGCRDGCLWLLKKEVTTLGAFDTPTILLTSVTKFSLHLVLTFVIKFSPLHPLPLTPLPFPFSCPPPSLLQVEVTIRVSSPKYG